MPYCRSLVLNEQEAWYALLSVDGTQRTGGLVSLIVSRWYSMDRRLGKPYCQSMVPKGQEAW
jgi:hypothetical protein